LYEELKGRDVKKKRGAKGEGVQQHKEQHEKYKGRGGEKRKRERNNFKRYTLLGALGEC